MSPKGGKREGSGRPAYYGKAMKRTNVMLDEETIAFYTEQGEGNLSEGIRQYWRKPRKRLTAKAAIKKPASDKAGVRKAALANVTNVTNVTT